MRGPLLAGFERVVRDRAHAPAVFALSEQRVLTFSELALEAEAIASAFEEAGVREGSTILELAGNRATWFALLVACMARGNTLVSLSAEAPSTEAEKIGSRYHASAMVCSASRADLSSDALTLPGGLRLVPRERADAAELPQFENTLLLKLTSGSSGEPKAVMVSEDNLWNDGRHIIDAMSIGERDVNYGVIPLSHSYGLGNLVAPLLIQGTVVALRELFFPGQLVEDARTSELSVLPGVPFLFEQILNQFDDKELPPSLRLLISAGARLERPLVSSFKEKLGAKIHSFYGSSETGGITFDDEDDITDPLTVGKPMPETEVCLRGDGRVHVGGNAVACGYVEKSDKESGEFVEGGFLTGDTGRFDDAGRLFLTGRVSSFVNIAGRKVNPAETEEIVRAMPEVQAAAVIGLPCDKRGQKLVAFIIRRSSELSALQIRSHCARHLSPHKIPRELVFVDELPRNDRGKIDHKKLEALSQGT